METDLALVEKQKQAYSMFQELQNARKNEAVIYFVQGKILKEIRDNKLFKYMGNGGFDTFQDFLNNPEVSMKIPTAYAYIGVYEFYVEHLQIPELDLVKIPLNRLIALKPRLKDLPVQEAVDTIDELKDLTHTDYVVKSKEKKLIDDEKPMLIKDKDSGKWIIHFHEKYVLEVRNLDSQVNLFDNRTT